MTSVPLTCHMTPHDLWQVTTWNTAMLVPATTFTQVGSIAYDT